MKTTLLIPAFFYVMLITPAHSPFNLSECSIIQDDAPPGTTKGVLHLNDNQNIETDNLLLELLSTTDSTDFDQVESSIDSLLMHIKSKKRQSSIDLLRAAFIATHHKFLRTFREYAGLEEIFVSGNYNCLTATCLFSILLERLDYNYQIFETNYHIFLIIDTGRGKVLLETTDANGGFVTNAQKIEERIKRYKQNRLTLSFSVPTKTYLSYDFKLYQAVSPRNLAGLLYFNQAVKAFNARSLERCVSLLNEAKSIYHSPRIETLTSVLLLTIKQSNLSERKKQMLCEDLRD